MPADRDDQIHDEILQRAVSQLRLPVRLDPALDERARDVVARHLVAREPQRRPEPQLAVLATPEAVHGQHELLGVRPGLAVEHADPPPRRDVDHP